MYYNECIRLIKKYGTLVLSDGKNHYNITYINEVRCCIENAVCLNPKEENMMDIRHIYLNNTTTMTEACELTERLIEQGYSIIKNDGEKEI